MNIKAIFVLALFLGAAGLRADDLVSQFAKPPASDVVSTYILEAAGSGTKITLQTEANLMPAGMPSVPGMEDMMKKQMMTSYESTLAALKKAIEG